ncbi:MAG: ADP-ribosylglycohydrolase family protein [Ruminococcaceae bacterium]|nr:ADP-ribosylglycohydrolase family protein [Oscillospiraceae bacterium]
MIYFNKEKLRDKIYACWIGKNIGGTLGGPYEGHSEFLDVQGFITEKGEPLPNDDLDLQLVFLCAVEELGPAGINPASLSEYWLNYIPPAWNEYGVGKSNLRAGIPAPLSGELFNEKWKTSNGAWIRSELWACLTPGYPELAAKFAFADACVDHGLAEGTHAEIFTTYLECNAFFNPDIRGGIEAALKEIPQDSRVAKTIRLAMECYDKGMTLKDAREAVVEETKDMGWFQAPINIGFVILGLMYGEGDFKKSMLATVNCGDDTDCTAATVGAYLGILYGMDGIPKDWLEYIGDDIINIAVDKSYRKIPKTCTELTDRIMNLIQPAFRSFKFTANWTEGDHQAERGYEENWFLERTIRSPFNHRTKYCYDVPCSPFLYAIVCFEKEPFMKANEELEVKVVLKNGSKEQVNGQVNLLLPEGFSCDYPHNLQIARDMDEDCIWKATVRSGDVVNHINRIIMDITIAGRPLPALIPINIFG